MIYSRFESEITIMPRDIDINAHVHHSVYLDYLLAARFDQMARCYKMSMDDFIALGYTWFARRYEIEYRHPLAFGDTAVVRTWVIEVGRVSVNVGFEIESRQSGRTAAKGTATFVLIDIEKNRPASIPEEVRKKYSV